MKKQHILFLSLLLFAFIVNAQNRMKIPTPHEQMALTSEPKSVDPDFLKQTKQFAKAFGDTLYYQDFNGGLPAGWSIVNNNSNTFVWQWDTVYQPGGFTTSAHTITSTTAANGFMSLPSDFYNTPIPVTGSVPMNTYFESATIDLTNGGLNPTGFPNVVVTYQQTMRNCCSSSNRLLLQVSSDNFTTFREFDATNGLAMSAASGTVTNAINISSVASNASNVKIRFLSNGNSHYYWMIDDFAIIEGAQNDLELRDPYLEFNSNYTYNPFYGQIPYDFFSPLLFSGYMYNSGSNDLTGVALDVDVIHTADISGAIGTGLGLVYSSSSSPQPLVSGLRRDTADYSVTSSPRFVPSACGTFRADILAISDSIDQNPINNAYSQNFIVGDTVFARDDNGYAGGTGPSDYVGGGTANGDRFGTMYIIESRTGNGIHAIPTSITFAVSNDTSNIGVEILPRIWSWDEDSATVDAAFTGLVATSFIPYTVQASDTGTLLTLPLDFGPATHLGLDSGQYVVGWEVLNFQNGTAQFEVFEDASSLPFLDPVTCFMDIANTAAGWTWVPQNPVIRLNIDNFPLGCRPIVGINDITSTTLEFSVNPNPSNGLIEMSLNSEKQKDYLMQVRNNLGQIVYEDQLSAKREFKKTFDFSSLEKGVYIILLSNQNERLTKKIILQ